MNSSLLQPACLKLSDLYRTLSNELAGHRLLLDLLREAQQSILDRSAVTLLEKVEAINTHLPKLDALRQHRDQLRMELAELLGLAPAVRFSHLMRHLPEELGSHVQSRVKAINDLLHSSQHFLRQNQLLLIRSLEQTDSFAVATGCSPSAEATEGADPWRTNVTGAGIGSSEQLSAGHHDNSR